MAETGTTMSKETVDQQQSDDGAQRPPPPPAAPQPPRQQQSDDQQPQQYPRQKFDGQAPVQQKLDEQPQNGPPQGAPPPPPYSPYGGQLAPPPPFYAPQYGGYSPHFIGQQPQYGPPVIHNLPPQYFRKTETPEEEKVSNELTFYRIFFVSLLSFDRLIFYYALFLHEKEWYTILISLIDFVGICFSAAAVFFALRNLLLASLIIRILDILIFYGIYVLITVWMEHPHYQGWLIFGGVCLVALYCTTVFMSFRLWKHADLMHPAMEDCA